LPLCVRMLNLNNFPPNQSPNSKRPYSIQLQKLKNSFKHESSSKNSLIILQNNIQYIINNKFKEILDQCKKV